MGVGVGVEEVEGVGVGVEESVGLGVGVAPADGVGDAPGVGVGVLPGAGVGVEPGTGLGVALAVEFWPVVGRGVGPGDPEVLVTGPPGRELSAEVDPDCG